MDNLVGVYRIRNTEDGKAYYGSSVSVNYRLAKHRNQLERGEHANDHLQRAWNKYGPDAFVFELVIRCSREDALFYEQRFLDAYWDAGESCYNISRDAKSCMRGLTMTPLHRARIAESHLGILHTEASKLKMSNSHQNKTTEEKQALKFKMSSIRKGKPWSQARIEAQLKRSSNAKTVCK